jgi:hypothetical protein
LGSDINDLTTHGADLFPSGHETLQ